MIQPDIALALAVFFLRIFNNAVSTIRVVFIARQQMLISSVLALIESLIFAFTVANVVNDLGNWMMLAAYSGGYAIGSYVGMALEKRLVKTFLVVNVIVQQGGHELALRLRDAGYGVTETLGDGRDGIVTMLRAIIDRRESPQVMSIIRESHPNAFIAVEEARTIRQGYFKGLPGGRR